MFLWVEKVGARIAGGVVGDKRRGWERGPRFMPSPAPTTTLREVPLPRFAGAEAPRQGVSVTLIDWPPVPTRSMPFW
jgi:hypothetical protein